MKKIMMKILTIITLAVVMSGCGKTEEVCVLEMGHFEIALPRENGLWEGPLETENGRIRYIQGNAILEAAYYAVGTFQDPEVFVDVLYNTLEDHGFEDLKKQKVTIGKYEGTRVDATLVKEDGSRGPISCWVVLDEDNGVHYLIAGGQDKKPEIIRKAVEKTFRVVH